MSKEKFEEKEAANERQKRWEEIEASVESVADKLGMPVDQKIKFPVAALIANGFKTTMSCEGHLDHGAPWPWIDIESPLAADIQKNRRYRLLDDTACLKDGWKSMSEKDKGEWNKFRDAIKDANNQEADRLRRILKEFYVEADTGKKLDVSVVAWPVWRLEPAEFSSNESSIVDKWTPKKKKEALQPYQKEFKRFAEFLKERFFSEK